MAQFGAHAGHIDQIQQETWKRDLWFENHSLFYPKRLHGKFNSQAETFTAIKRILTSKNAKRLAVNQEKGLEAEQKKEVACISRQGGRKYKNI